MALAGGAKLADPDGSRRAFEGFGVTGGLAKIGPVLLSVIEIALAVLLIFPQTSWYGAIGALVLLLLFIAQMAYQLAKGNSPDCHCFGQVYSAPVSTISIVRNVVFAIPAAVLAARGQTGQGAGIMDPGVNTLELVFGVVITALLLVATAYLRKISQRQDRILKELEVLDIVARDGGTVERNEAGTPNDGMPIGAVVPDFSVKTLEGSTVSLDDLRHDELPVLFLFVSPSCTPCRALMPDFEGWVEDLRDRVKLVFLTSGSADENRDKFGDAIGSSLYLQEGREVATIFRAQWTPSAVFVGADGRVASHIAAGDNAIRSLVESLENEDLQRDGVHFTNGTSTMSKAPIGEPVPEFRAEDVRGREITHESFKGKPTLVTFWSSTCPHCKAMIDELREWEQARGTDDLNLVVFTEAQDSIDLESPVIVDPEYKIADSLGMYGTPSAVLVNENGVVVSETAIGAPDVWALIGKRK